MPVRQQGYQICPFFLREAARTITCEGIAPGALCGHRFDTAQDRARHQREYCNSYGYPSCLWAAALMRAAEAGELDGYKCGLSDSGCPCSRPERGMCCSYCERRDKCPAPEWRCENDAGKCGYLTRGTKIVKKKQEEEAGTLFDFL